jgi:hypothetical protein
MKNEVRPVAEPLAGVRLVRGRPWALAATVLAVFLLQIGPTTFWSVLLDRAMETGGLLLSLVQPLGLALLELPTVGALTVVAVLSGRRVTVGRVLALWVLSVLVWLAALLVGGVAGGTGGWLVLVAVLAQAVKLVVLGLLAGGLFPAAAGANGVRSRFWRPPWRCRCSSSRWPGCRSRGCPWFWGRPASSAGRLRRSSRRVRWPKARLAPPLSRAVKILRRNGGPFRGFAGRWGFLHSPSESAKQVIGTRAC